MYIKVINIVFNVFILRSDNFSKWFDVFMIYDYFYELTVKLRSGSTTDVTKTTENSFHILHFDLLCDNQPLGKMCNSSSQNYYTVLI